MEQLPAPQQLMQMLYGFAVSRAIGVAAELRIADLVKDGPQTAEELARQTNVHARSLYRLLRACAGAGVFSEDAEHRFSLTPLAEPLISDAPHSLRAFAEMFTTDWQYQTWAGLLNSVRTGAPAFNMVHGMSAFDFFWGNERAGRQFNEAMTSNSAFISGAVVEAYDFSPFTRIVDVGGGHGALLSAILSRYSTATGVLYDVPAVAAAAESELSRQGLAHRSEARGGDFFKEVPEGADAYIMQFIIHDWNDDQCVGILGNCRRSMAPGGKVLVIEMVVPEGNEPSLSKLMDLQMLQYLPGCERTAPEYRDLFHRAGLRLTRIIPTASPFSIMEGEQAE